MIHFLSARQQLWISKFHSWSNKTTSYWQFIDNFVTDDDDIDCNYDDNVIDDDFDYANITNDDINCIDNDDDDYWEGREGPLIVIDDDDDDDYSNVDDDD